MDAEAVVEVDDGLDDHTVVAQEVDELGEGVGTEAFRASDARGAGECGLGEMEVEHAGAAGLAGLGLAREQCGGVVGSGEQGEGLGAELVSAEVGVLLVGGQPVGELLHDGVDADGAVGGDPGDHRPEPGGIDAGQVS